jgi:hypothetical protein
MEGGGGRRQAAQAWEDEATQPGGILHNSYPVRGLYVNIRIAILWGYMHIFGSQLIVAIRTRGPFAKISGAGGKAFRAHRRHAQPLGLRLGLDDSPLPSADFHRQSSPPPGIHPFSENSNHLSPPI